MQQTKFSVFYRKLCGHVKFGDNIFGSKINWNEYQTKFNLCQLESSKTFIFDKIIWEDVTSGLIMRRLPLRYFFRKFTTIQNHLQEGNVAHVRRCYSMLFRDRAFCLRSRVLGLWQCYISKSGWIGDEMKGMIMKQAPGTKRSTFEIYEAGKVESKGTSPDYSKPRMKCPFKKSRAEEMPCDTAEVMTVQCSSTADGENCEEVDECGRACSSSGDGKKKKSWLSNVRSCKSSSRSGCCPPEKSNSRNRSCGKCPPTPTGPVTCRKPCVPCACPPCPCPPPPCPPPCPPPKSRCCPPPPCCPPPCCPPPCCPPPCPPPPPPPCCPPPCCPPPCCPPPCCPPPCCPPPCCPKMEALQFDAACRALNFYMLNAPTSIRKDEVLVQVVYSGVSCIDLMIMEGRFPIKCQPVILGHEISGIACAVGSGVCHVKCGDCIAVNPYGACQVCRYCTRGQFGSCVCEGLCNSIGINKDGGWAEFVVVNKTQVHPIPACLTLPQAVLIQPLSCIVNAMSRLDLQFGADIVIQGLDISGCLWASLLHLKGFRNVIASDMSEYKRKLLECLDLKYCVYPPEKMCDVKADIVIDCTGCARSIEQSVNMLNPNGQLCIFGIAPPEEQMSIQPYELTRKEATVFSVVTNTNSFTRAIAAAEAMGCRYLDYEKLGMQLFKLGQYEGAFQMKRCGEINKIVFKIDNSK